MSDSGNDYNRHSSWSRKPEYSNMPALHHSLRNMMQSGSDGATKWICGVVNYINDNPRGYGDSEYDVDNRRDAKLIALSAILPLCVGVYLHDSDSVVEFLGKAAEPWSTMLNGFSTV